MASLRLWVGLALLLAGPGGCSFNRCGSCPDPMLPDGLCSPSADGGPDLDGEVPSADGDGGAVCFPGRRYRVALAAPAVPVAMKAVPILLDLAAVLPGSHGLWSEVQADGGDLVVTDGAGSRLPLEVVQINTAGKTGELWFAGDLGPSGALFYLHHGADSTATQPGWGESHGAAAVWDGDHVAVWHLSEDGDGTTDEFRDSTANSLHGTGGDGDPARAPTPTSGRFGVGAQHFDAAKDQMIEAGNASAFDLTTGLTLQGWASFDSFNAQGSGDPSVLTKRYAYRLAADSNNQRPLASLDQAGGDGATIEGPQPLVAATWYHLAMTFDGQFQRLYVNGKLEQISMTVTKINTSTSPVEIGSFGLNGAHMDGALDEVRLSQTARSADHIAVQHAMMADNATWWANVGDRQRCP